MFQVYRSVCVHHLYICIKEVEYVVTKGDLTLGGEHSQLTMVKGHPFVLATVPASQLPFLGLIYNPEKNKAIFSRVAILERHEPGMAGKDEGSHTGSCDRKE